MYKDEYGNVYDEYELGNMYDELLDDVYGLVQIAGLSYETSSVLKEVDHIAYREGFLDYVDGLAQDQGWTEL